MLTSDPLPIIPFTRPARGEVAVPGSKSITNRALLLAALCGRPVRLEGALFSEDTVLMATALRRLGIPVESDARAATLEVQGRGGELEAPDWPIKLFVGLAGTAARFLTALCAAAPRGVYQIDGVPQMRQRPMAGLIEALRELGADIRCLGEEGFFPVEIRARGLHGGSVAIDASESSQMLSALLMVAPLARSEVTIRLAAPVREPFVVMTANLMRCFGVEVASEPGTYRTPRRPYRLESAAYAIEPDATAASYFLALPLVAGGELRLRHISPESLQGDIRFAEVLRRAGLALEFGGGGLTARFAGARRNVTEDFRNFSDTFLTLAAIAPLLPGPTRISGIGHTRKQETDRVGKAAAELRNLGQEVEEEADALTVTPRPLVAGTTVQTHGDHRFAMSFAILGCHDLRGDGSPWLTIENPGCCAKTFPQFFELLESLRRKSSEA